MFGTEKEENSPFVRTSHMILSGAEHQVIHGPCTGAGCSILDFPLHDLWSSMSDLWKAQRVN